MSYDVNVLVVISKFFFFSYQWIFFFLIDIEYVLEFFMQIKFPWNFNI